MTENLEGARCTSMRGSLSSVCRETFVQTTQLTASFPLELTVWCPSRWESILAMPDSLTEPYCPGSFEIYT
jgi:hypothetical protein